MKEKKKIVKGLPKRIRAFVLALVMVCTLLPMTAMTAYATNYSNCRWDITTNGGVISSVKFSFNTTDTASGTWKLYLWDKADTSGPNARPAILSESSLTTVNGSHVMELHYNGQAGHEYSVAMCLKDSNWSTQTHNVANEPYVERICDWYGLDAEQLQGTVYLDGGKSEKTVSEVFGQLSSGKAAAAPKEFSFNYAADCQRSPAYPKKGDSFTASGFGNPLNGNETFADRMEGNWKLISKGLYTGNDADYPGNYGLGDVISSAASVYGVNGNEIEVFELQESGKHIAYGVLCSAFEGTALYIGDTWSGGGGYVLSNVNLNSENEVSGTITNDVSTGFEEAPLPTGHTHGAWEYTANGATLTAECKAEGTCTLPENKVSLTLTAKSQSYSGNQVSASIDSAAWQNADIEVPTIMYVGNGTTTYPESEAAPVAAGTYTAMITAGNKTAATDFEITKADAALKVTPDFSKIYGDEAFALNATKATDAVIEYSVKSGNAVSVDAQGMVTVERAGTATITASVAENDNYFGDSKDITVKVAKKNGTLTISKLTYEVTYGDEDFDIGEMTSEGDADSVITFTGYDANVISVNANGRVSIKAVGETQIRVNRANGTNYNPAQEVIVSVNVVPKAITVTADDKMITYGDQDAELTYSNSTLVGQDTLDIQLQRETGTDAGDYEITASQDVGANPNYDITFVSGNYKILKKNITNADVILDQALVENGKMQAQQVASVVIDGLDVTYDLTDNTGDTAGVYTLTITGNGNFTGMITKTFVIAPAANSYLATDDEDAFIMGQGTIAVSVQAIGVSAELVSDKGEVVKMFVESGEISAEDLAAVASGSNIEIVLTVKDASQTITPENKALLEKGCVGYTVGQHLDLSLELIVNGDSRIITETAEKLTIKVVVPEKLINKDAAIIRMFAIVRNHEGNVEILSTDYETAAQAVTFQTDRFSDYAIAYKDVKNKDYKPADTNTGVSPETGDNSCLTVWFMMSAIALAAVVVLLQEIKKRNRLERRK